MSPAFLADFQPISPGFQVDTYSLLLVAAALGGLVIGVLGLWLGSRRKPPVDVDLVKLEGAIETLQTAVDKLAEWQQEHAGHKSELSALHEKVRKLELLRESDAQSQRSYIQKSAQDIFARIESHVRTTHDQITAFTTQTHAEFVKVTSTFAENIQRIERAVGQIEGAQAAMRDRLNAG